MATREPVSIATQTLAELQELRDQIEVKMHVAGIAAKQHLQRLEAQLMHLQKSKEGTGDSAQRTISAVLNAIHDLSVETTPSNSLERTRVFQMMQVDVQTCGRDDRLSTASHLMWRADCGSIPVVDHLHQLIGIITDRDICMAAYTQGIRFHDSCVYTAMARHVWTCAADDTLLHALELMRKCRVRRLPVVDSNQRLLGIITLGDISRFAHAHAPEITTEQAQADITSTFAAVSEPRPRTIAMH